MLATLGNRGGDLARPSFDGVPSAGDFDLATLAKGDVDEAKTSNAERFTGAVDGSLGVLGINGDGDLTGVDGMAAGAELCEEGRLPKEDLAEEKIFWPLTEAKGELVEA